MKANTDTAVELLRSASIPATAAYLACNQLLPETWLAWEPETVWLTLRSEHKLELHEDTRSKILAIRSLQTTGTFWNDALVFEKTVMACNHESMNVEGLEDCPVMFICAAVTEINAFVASEDTLAHIDFDREPLEYMTVQLFREGFILAPEQLSRCQSRLDKRYPDETKQLRKEVAAGWSTAPRKKLLSAAFPETSAGVQLAKLAAVHSYVENHVTALRSALTKLRG